MKNYFDKFPDSYVQSSRRMIQTPSAFARSALFYVQETGYLKLRESHLARRKNLESYLVVLVLSGSGTLMYQDTAYPLKKGSCFFIDCQAPYYHQSSNTDPWELIWVHFNGSSSREYYQYFSSKSTPAFSPQVFLELKDSMENLLEINTASELSTEISSSRLIVELLSLLLLDITERHTENHPGHQKMAQVRQYLDEHYTEKFSLDALSEKFFISKFHLSREFRTLYGITLNHYVIARRITLAKKLLRFSDHTLEEIAIKCGFYDASHLNRQFKKSEDICASDFRKKWIN